jgi:hypothetical protein
VTKVDDEFFSERVVEAAERHPTLGACRYINSHAPKTPPEPQLGAGEPTSAPLAAPISGSWRMEATYVNI